MNPIWLRDSRIIFRISELNCLILSAQVIDAEHGIVGNAVPGTRRTDICHVWNDRKLLWLHHSIKHCIVEVVNSTVIDDVNPCVIPLSVIERCTSYIVRMLGINSELKSERRAVVLVVGDILEERMVTVNAHQLVGIIDSDGTHRFYVEILRAVVLCRIGLHIMLN